MARRTKKKKLSDLPAQPDPGGSINPSDLLSAAQPVLKQLKTDLAERARASAEVTRALKARHQSEREAQRTADSFEQWQ